MNSLLAISMPGPFELLVLAGLGLLFFGKRLPEVGRSIGQTIVQFKKGLNDVGAEIDKAETKQIPSEEKKQIESK